MKKFFSTFILALVVVFIGGCGTFQKKIHVKMNKPVHIKQNVTRIAIITPKEGLKINEVIAHELALKLEAKGKTISNLENAELIITLSVPQKSKLRDEKGNIIELSALSMGVASAATVYGGTKSGTKALGAGMVGATVGGLFGYIVKDSTVSLKLDLVLSDPKSPENLQQTRIFSTVRQVHLGEEDGREILVDELSSKIANLF
jgi:hypothetical protein